MLTFNAEIRKNQGKRASRRLRLANKLPAIVYGANITPMLIGMNHEIVFNAQKKKGFYSDVLALLIDGKETHVKIQAIQRHPFKPKLIHIDFLCI